MLVTPSVSLDFGTVLEQPLLERVAFGSIPVRDEMGAYRIASVPSGSIDEDHNEETT
jgi:hypothetical protein